MGHNEFVSRGAARVNVAGDSDDPTGPTYETMGTLTSVSYPGAEGLAISGTIDRDGVVEGTPPATVDMLRAHGVTFGPYSAETDKYTASVFWDFANSQGPVYQNGAVQTDQLFDPWFYATGLPVTDAWWANVKIANTYKWVLVQCFERRCLTYTPDNVNGELLGTATHDALGSGPVTVFASRNFDANPVEVAYRNLYYFEVK